MKVNELSREGEYYWMIFGLIVIFGGFSGGSIFAVLTLAGAGIGCGFMGYILHCRYRGYWDWEVFLYWTTVAILSLCIIEIPLNWSAYM